jgi:signal transduction histidine kinase
MNLARNAVEHTGPGDRIEIGARATAGFVQVWVRDEGEGIAAADQQRIFERFARGGARPRGSEGAGLGLAIVRAIAEAHGGRVEVASRPGEGATFTMTIPIDRPAGGRP